MHTLPEAALRSHTLAGMRGAERDSVRSPCMPCEPPPVGGHRIWSGDRIWHGRSSLPWLLARTKIRKGKMWREWGGAQDLTGLIVDQVSGGQGGDVLREEETWWKPHCNCPRVCTPIRWR
jgi:hypothetical protein